LRVSTWATKTGRFVNYKTKKALSQPRRRYQPNRMKNKGAYACPQHIVPVKPRFGEGCLCKLPQQQPQQGNGIGGVLPFAMKPWIVAGFQLR
jgi:hypothetical protein